MTDDYTEGRRALARRVVACSCWAWRPGMAWEVVREAPLEAVRGRVLDSDPWTRDGWTPYPGAVPVLDDPATRGCLLQLVRDAHDDPSASTHHVASRVWIVDVESAPDGYDEVEALVLALEAAPAVPSATR